MNRRFVRATLAALLMTAGAAAQSPVASIDLYGIRELDPELVRAAVDVPLDEPFRGSPAEIRRRLLAIEGVVDAAVSPVQLTGPTHRFDAPVRRHPGSGRSAACAAPGAHRRRPSAGRGHRSI